MPERQVIDVTGRPDLCPPGDFLTICDENGSRGITMPRADALYNVERGNPGRGPKIYLLLLPDDNPF